MFKETPEAQAIIAWHDSQTEELLASLPGYEDGLTPRQAWEAFCSLPAEKQPGQGLAASADAGQGARILRPFLPHDDGLPFGGWCVICSDCLGALVVPSPPVWGERRA